MGEIKIKSKLSYTALSTFDNCQYRYFLQYLMKQRSNQTTLALELGTIAHKVKELISLDLMSCKKPDYDDILETFRVGWYGEDKSTGKKERIAGVTELRSKYNLDWYTPDNKTGMDYEEKIGIFIKHLQDEEYDFENWFTVGVEVPFEFDFEGWTFHGFIDKISMNAQNQIRITDYKTSKQVYGDDYIKTPLQMLIYNIAVRKLYPDHEIVGHTYDFIFIGEKQEGGTVGWVKRGEKKLHNMLAKMSMNFDTGIWEPKPSPLCHYCDYCPTNENADPAYTKLCPYYSLWVPENKTYDKARNWDGRKAEKIYAECQTGKKEFIW